MQRALTIVLVAALCVVSLTQVIVLKWPQYFTPNVRYNFSNVFTWAVMAAFSVYIALCVNLWIGLFLALASFSTIFPINSLLSEKAHMYVLLGVLWYVICVQALTTGKSISWVMNFFCLVAIANTIFLIFQAFDYNILQVGVKRPRFASIPFDPVPNCGLLDHQNSASALSAFSFSAFLRPYWIYFVGFMVVGFVCAKTFAGPLAVVCALGVLACFRLPKKWVLVSFISLAILLTGYMRFVDRPDPTWRLIAWKTALFELLPQRPFTGGGLGHWKMAFQKQRIKDKTPFYVASQAHNEYVQGTLEMGIGFIVVVAGYYIDIVYRLFKRARMGHALVLALMALTIITVNLNIDFIFHKPFLPMMALAWMAMLECLLRDENIKIDHVFTSFNWSRLGRLANVKAAWRDLFC